MKLPLFGYSVDVFDIYNYQNSGLKEKEGYSIGLNEMILKEAREAYKNGEEVS